jgi:hypothetical protein
MGVPDAADLGVPSPIVDWALCQSPLRARFRSGPVSVWSLR